MLHVAEPRRGGEARIVDRASLDIEAAFLYPWAAVFRDMARQGLGMLGFGEMALFIGVLVVGLVYCWRRGALDWE